MNKIELEKVIKSIKADSKFFPSDIVVYYDDNQDVLAVSGPEAIVIAVDIPREPDNIMLLSFKDDGIMATFTVARDRLWVMPNREVLSEFADVTSPKVFPKTFFPEHYVVNSYGCLELPDFKYRDMFGSQLEILLQNHDGDCFTTFFIPDENCIAGSGNYPGNIYLGYQYVTLGEIDPEEPDKISLTI